MTKLFVLGGDDPEMSWIERHLQQRRVPYVFAGRNLWQRNDSGNIVENPFPRVRTHNAYRSEFVIYPTGYMLRNIPEQTVLVECKFVGRLRIGAGGIYEMHRNGAPNPPVHIVDHHNAGDPGFGVSPDRFWEASSIGQILTLIDPNYEIDKIDYMVAAADHCLMAAYAGQCPGVDPDELGMWRIHNRALRKRCTPKWIIDQIGIAADKLISANKVLIGGEEVADLREVELPEIKEAACRLGLAYITKTKPNRNGRSKVVLGGASSNVVRSFIKGESIAGTLARRYGDPARGYAGGYEARTRR